MSSIVQEVMSQILVSLITSKREDLLLLLNEADFHQLAANESELMAYEKNLAQAEKRYFMGVQIKLVKSKSAPQVVRVVV